MENEPKRTWMIPVIERARTLISNGLCKEATACDTKGNPAALDSDAAKRFSLSGALQRAVRDCKVSPGRHNDVLLYFSGVIGKDLTKANEDAEHIGDLHGLCDRVLDTLPPVRA